jgi:hypothetical protein
LFEMDSQHFLICIISIWRWINSSFCILSLPGTLFCVFGTPSEL